MANVYVRSGAGGAGTGADWANAYITLAAAYTAKAAGDTFWVSEDHAETQASLMTLTCPGTIASPCRTLCVNHSGSVPPVSADLATTATIATTGANGITFLGCSYLYGLNFNCGSGAGSSTNILFGGAAQTVVWANKCALNLTITTSNNCLLQIGAATSSIGVKLVLEDSTLQFGHANHGIYLYNGTNFRWFGSSSTLTGAAFPTTLFQSQSIVAGFAELDGVDLSPLSGKTLFAAMAKGGCFEVKDCKLPASVTISATPISGAPEIYLTRSASGATAYAVEKYTAYGTQTTEITVVRTGGKTVNGTAVSMKVVGTSSATPSTPFTATPIIIGNTVTGSARTITVYGVWSGGAVPTDKQVWMEVGYLGSSGSPQLSFDKGTGDILNAGNNQPSDTSTWGGGTTKFKMTATFTAQLAGELYVRVRSASTNTVYIDPLPVLS